MTNSFGVGTVSRPVLDGYSDAHSSYLAQSSIGAYSTPTAEEQRHLARQAIIENTLRTKSPFMRKVHKPYKAERLLSKRLEEYEARYDRLQQSQEASDFDFLNECRNNAGNSVVFSALTLTLGPLLQTGFQLLWNLYNKVMDTLEEKSLAAIHRDIAAAEQKLAKKIEIAQIKAADLGIAQSDQTFDTLQQHMIALEDIVNNDVMSAPNAAARDAQIENDATIWPLA